ncbi:MAG: hypothetical protein CMO06_05735 [Thalassospira sp.]|jgi:hypothetical protein|nr:hypothetical protein [Thalassospira sp.]
MKARDRRLKGPNVMSITLFDGKRRLSTRGCTAAFEEKSGDSSVKVDFTKAKSACGGKTGIIK